MASGGLVLSRPSLLRANLVLSGVSSGSSVAAPAGMDAGRRGRDPKWMHLGGILRYQRVMTSRYFAHAVDRGISPWNGFPATSSSARWAGPISRVQAIDDRGSHAYLSRYCAAGSGNQRDPMDYQGSLSRATLLPRRREEGQNRTTTSGIRGMSV
jgi:hypothetical protein